MTNVAKEKTSGCTVRCLDRQAVATARKAQGADGATRVAYTCQISGRQEAILLLGEALAARLAERVPEARDAVDASILAGLHSAELCECDVATLAGLADDDAAARLRRLADAGLLTHQRLHAMNYYRLEADAARAVIEQALASLP